MRLDFRDGLVARTGIPADIHVEFMNHGVTKKYLHHKHFVVAHTSKSVIFSRVPIDVLK